jgi:hypothetical protein
MRHVFLGFISILFCLVLFTLSFAQSAKEAVMALKKLQTRVEVGVSYEEYFPALGEAKFPVTLYLESPEAAKNPQLKAAVEKSLGHYQLVARTWQNYIDDYSGFMGWRCNRSFICTEKGDMLISEYPEVDNARHEYGYSKEVVFGVIWAYASADVKKASDLLRTDKPKKKR